jgi:transcriptional regulator with XRE-family HTH domain
LKRLQEKLSELPVDRRQKIAQRTEALVAQEMTLRELRKVREITQTDLAAKLGVKQEQISRSEHRTDARISTLQQTIEAMGGELIVMAQFPDAKPIRITGFQKAEVQAARRRPAASKRRAS